MSFGPVRCGPVTMLCVQRAVDPLPFELLERGPEREPQAEMLLSHIPDRCGVRDRTPRKRPRLEARFDSLDVDL